MHSGRTTTESFARRFFLAAIAVCGAAAGLSSALMLGFPPPPAEALRLPGAFVVTSLLLLVVSGALHRAVQLVRQERQRPFRRALCFALFAGVAFVGVQGYGLACLLTMEDPVRAQTGAVAFVFAFAAMHGLHVVVALLFLLFVTLRATADRYDHEYYWGVAVTGWFWHALGIAWLAILAVISIAV
ncbi:MAG: cytochrome c oxidase subunit 3 [Planctomycetaceae bacterium]